MWMTIRKVVIPIAQHAALLLYSAWKSYTSLAYFLKPYMHMGVKNKYWPSWAKIQNILKQCYIKLTKLEIVNNYGSYETESLFSLVGNDKKKTNEWN